nr:MAG TPA: hypothetical protein [Caudoviricetes sp.]
MYCIKFIVKPHFLSTQKGHLTLIVKCPCNFAINLLLLT